MALFTTSFTLDTSEVEIKVASDTDTITKGVIPSGHTWRQITFLPNPQEDGTSYDWYIYGTTENCSWTLVPKENNPFSLDKIRSGGTICKIKASSGSFTMLMYVEGD